MRIARCDKFSQVNGTKIASIPGTERLLPARIGRLYGFSASDNLSLLIATFNNGIVSVYPVNKYDSRLACGVGIAYYLLKNFSRLAPSCSLSRPRMYEFIISIIFQSLHEPIGNSYRDIEIVELPCVFFGPDEFFDIRMIYPKHPHICTTPGAALTNGFGGGIIHAHKANRT